jgi:archaellum component FlaC
MSEKAIKNNNLLKQISAELSSISQEIANIKKSMIDIKGDVTKLNMIEEKIKKGEYDAKYNNGWWWWREIPS